VDLVHVGCAGPPWAPISISSPTALGALYANREQFRQSSFDAADVCFPPKADEVERLQQALGVVCHVPGRKGKLRIVA
jgi:hypothetical protein